MYLHIWLVAFFGFCACTKYSDDESKIPERLLEIFEIDRNLGKIAKAVSPERGLKERANEAQKDVNALEGVVKFLFEITERLSRPCREGIYRNWKCVNYILADKFHGSQRDARNLCRKHKGTFKKERIADNSHSHHPYSNYQQLKRNNIFLPGPPQQPKQASSARSVPPQQPKQASSARSVPLQQPKQARNARSVPPQQPKQASSARFILPEQSEEDESYESNFQSRPYHQRKKYYVCYTLPEVNIPNSLDFPGSEDDDDEMNGPYRPKYSNNIWFSGAENPRENEDECPSSAKGGRIINDRCYAMYTKPRTFEAAKHDCKKRRGSLCRPGDSTAVRDVFIIALRENFPDAFGDMEAEALKATGTSDTVAYWYDYAQIELGGTLLALKENSARDPYEYVTDYSWMASQHENEHPYCCQFDLV